MHPALHAPLRSRITALLLCAVAFLVFSACGGAGTPARADGAASVEELGIETTHVPAAFWQEAYSFALTAKGGSKSYTWALTAGSKLPAGLTFDATGVVRGTPRAAGTFTLAVRVTDEQHPTATVTRSFPLLVSVGIHDLQATPGPQRGTVVLRFTAPPAGTAPVTAYEIRASIRHIMTAADLASATIVPQTHVPGAPGALETITLTGLDPGQTLQFAVRPVSGGTPGAAAFAVAARVAVGSGPARPANAVSVSSPGTLSTPGVYYLDRDVSATGTAFTITSKDVVLDLDGHTITYGTGAGRAHGIYADGVAGAVTIRNGALVQGAGGGAACHGARLLDVDTIRISNLTVTVTGTDADGISLYGIPRAVRVDGCTIHCRTRTVTNRHWPGVAAIRIDEAAGSAEVDHNLITASPQWGLRLQGKTSSGDVLVHHNIVRTTKALVANGYMLGIYKRNADVFENDLRGESRGIHIASDGSDGIDCRVHDNVLSVQDQTNAEYPDLHWVHGIKIEGAPGCKVYDNVVTGVADDDHAEVRAVDVTLQNREVPAVGGVEIVRNRVRALATSARFTANAFLWSAGTIGATNDLVVRHNVFTATDRIVRHEWDGGRGALMRENVLLRDLGLGAAHTFYVEDFGNGGETTPGNRLLDSFTTLRLGDVTEYHAAHAYDATREWTLAFLVRDARGAPVPDAIVLVTDASGARVFETRTDDEGQARGSVVEATITKGPSVAEHGPFAVTITKTGVGSYRGTHPVQGRTALVVDLAAGTAAADTTAPTAPDTLYATPLSASRVLLRWGEGSDAVGIAVWLVYVDDELAGITDGMRFVVPGLDPATRHAFSVRALDFAGNLAAPVAAEATTHAEDRGPAR